MKLQNAKEKTVELLAPAGNLSCALAAFDAGADAVYAGLKDFNARERSENFSAEEMSKLLACAAKHGKKVYVAFNTLVREDEIPRAAETLAELEKLRPDALIVQDLGVLRIIRDFFPGLKIHASTQMGLHNSAGLALAKELGVSRVILERQTTIGEIEKMMSSTPEVELEIFIHGALCCCISGSCLLSSWLGGWSGNRGRCKQPCRRRYHTPEGNGFFLSAKDLCTIEILPRILKSGVAALKIEGRLRRADYVENVVSAYRLAISAAANPDPAAFTSALPEARELLAKTCGRKWSLGFYTEESRKNLVKHDSPGASGQLCGKVIRTTDSGFTALLSRRVHLGDTLRIQPRTGDEGPALTVTKMSVSGRAAARALKGETVFICSDKKVIPGSPVYKTGESVRDFSSRIQALPLRRVPADLEIKLSRENLEIRAGGKCFRKTLALEEAGKTALSPETLKAEFSLAGTGGLEAGKISASVSGNPFLPASVLKNLRRDFSRWMAENLSAEDLCAGTSKHLKDFLARYESLPGPPDGNKRRFPDAVILPRGKKISAPAGMSVVREIAGRPAAAEELLLPFFVRENRLQEIRKAIKTFVEKGGKTVRITSLHHLALLRDYPQLKIKTCMPLPVCNSIAAEELASLGATLGQGWIELGKKELEALAGKSPLPLEQYRFGRPVLLSTHAAIPAEGVLTDARGNAFRISHDGDLTQLTAERVMSVPPAQGLVCSLFDCRHADLPEEEPGEAAVFNFECSLV